MSRVKEVKKQQYKVTENKQAREIALEYLKGFQLEKAIEFGLPEVDDRYHIWRVPVKSPKGELIGEITIDAITTLINDKKSSQKEVLESRLLGRKISKDSFKAKSNGQVKPKISTIKNTIGLGDSEELLADTPSESVDLVFTSPPYYNARPEYADYITYEEYLLKMRKVINQCHRVLNDGRFFVINSLGN